MELILFALLVLAVGTGAGLYLGGKRGFEKMCLTFGRQLALSMEQEIAGAILYTTKHWRRELTGNELSEEELMSDALQLLTHYMHLRDCEIASGLDEE